MASPLVPGVTVNHVGQCVSDLDRARSFYVDVFGFAVVREMEVPDASARLLGLEPPLGMTALYLERDGFVLELLHYADREVPPPDGRTMDRPGLTHLSLGVNDLEVALDAVREHGGEVLDDTHVGVACFVRDPEGQLLELLVGWSKPTR